MQEPKTKNRLTAIILALIGTITPFPFAGVHKLYLGQFSWGLVYFLLWSTPIPRIAAAIDAVWYLLVGVDQFGFRLVAHPEASTMINPIPETIRELDLLRSQGLISELEFEQKRRSLLDRI